jgi:hypothetical protein
LGRNNILSAEEQEKMALATAKPEPSTEKAVSDEDENPFA